jgi:hypothetical protein
MLNGPWVDEPRRVASIETLEKKDWREKNRRRPSRPPIGWPTEQTFIYLFFIFIYIFLFIDHISQQQQSTKQSSTSHRSPISLTINNKNPFAFIYLSFFIFFFHFCLLSYFSRFLWRAGCSLAGFRQTMKER